MFPRPKKDFHDLMAERYECAATVLTSNLDFSEWGEAFASNKTIGAATLDRLRHGAYRVVLDGKSHGSLKPLSDTPKTTVARHGKSPILEPARTPEIAIQSGAFTPKKSLAQICRKVTLVYIGFASRRLNCRITLR